MDEAQRNRLEHLGSIEFLTPGEFAELRTLLAVQTDDFARRLRGAQ